MRSEIVVCETQNCRLSENAKSGIKKTATLAVLDCNTGTSELANLLDSAPPHTFFFLPFEIHSETLKENIRDAGRTNFVFWIGKSIESSNNIALADLEDENFLVTILRAHDPERSTGIKHFLAPGSSIYYDSFFSLGGIGSKLDPCFSHLRTKLGLAHAIAAWSGLGEAIFTAFQSFLGQDENGTGERVDIQIGADDGRVCLSVCYDVKENFNTLCKSLESNLLRKSTNYFEVRTYPKLKKVEINSIYIIGTKSSTCLLSIQSLENIALERPAEVANYTFQKLSSIDNKTSDRSPTNKAMGFKHKFSTQISAPEKNNSLQQSKIESLENTLKQREELVVKLNREIESIKDPQKLGVISSIIDNKVEGLSANIKRLETELEIASRREKELSCLLDKSIIQKDEAQKKVKELETKLRNSLENNNSKVLQLEKQLEMATNQSRDLIKKLAKFTEKTLGKKAA